MKTPPETQLYLHLLEAAYRGPAWHGPCLRGPLVRAQAVQALSSLAGCRHNAWQLALHCAYWKYAVRRKLQGEANRGGFGRGPSNWPALPTMADSAAWRADLALLDQQHRALLEAVRSFPPAKWARRAPGSKYRFSQWVTGAANHDLYHAGQIRLLLAAAGRAAGASAGHRKRRMEITTQRPGDA